MSKLIVSEIIEYFEQDFAHTDSWQFIPGKAKEAAALLKELEAAGRALLEWEKKYPEDTIYCYGEHKICENELLSIIERFRGLLEPKT